MWSFTIMEILLTGIAFLIVFVLGMMYYKKLVDDAYDQAERDWLLNQTIRYDPVTDQYIGYQAPQTMQYGEHERRTFPINEFYSKLRRDGRAVTMVRAGDRK